MNEEFRGLESGPVKLVIGPEEQHLYAPKEIIDRIPFFQKLLSEAKKPDCCLYTLVLPDFSPVAVANVISFVWTKNDSLLAIDDTSDNWDQLTKKITQHVETYILARRLGMSGIQKSTRRAVVARLRRRYANPHDLMLLHRAGLQNCLLYKVLLADLGHDFARGGLKNLIDGYPEYESVCKNMPQGVLWKLMRSIDAAGAMETIPSREDHWMSNEVDE